LNRLLLFAAGLLALAASTGAAAAFESISAPVGSGNLAVYFVRGSGTGTAAPMPLDEALATGAVKINESPLRPITIDNTSARAVFVPIGTLITGGLQDQVVAQSMIVPPGSTGTPLDIYCIDPFRAAARGDEDPLTFTSNGTLFPWRMARLALLANGSQSKPIELLRQSGIWWSIDTVRAQLSARLGEALEPPRAVTWKDTVGGDARPSALLRAREATWRTSLPLALENRKLAEALAPYQAAFPAQAQGADVIGAVFAINGRIEGAEIYQSHELFGRMWPNLLRAYATQALAASDADASQILPPVSEVNASLAAAQEAAARSPAVAFVVRENEATILAEARDGDGNWIQRSFVPKLVTELAPTASLSTPDAMVASILQSGEVDGRAVASLADRQVVVLQHDDAGQWSTAIAPSLEVARDFAPAQWSDRERIEAERSTAWLRQAAEWQVRRDRHSADVLWAVMVLAFSFGFSVLLVRGAVKVAARGIPVAARVLAVATTRAAALITTGVAELAIIAVATLTILLRLTRRTAAALAGLVHGLARAAAWRPALLRPALVRARD
jgi:hypothetical protein